MKKQFLNVLFCCLMAIPAMTAYAQSTAEEGQSTEGTDFWVTFLQADQGSNKLFLELSISSRTNCEVTISNPFTSYSEKRSVTANQRELVRIYEGDSPMASSVRSDMAASGKVCYAVNSEQIDTCALHISATAPISLFATNYKYATFDATNVLPTKSLLDEYIVQNYTPSDHDGTSQGSHFCVIATQDSTIIDYVPTVPTKAIGQARNAYAFSQGIGMTEEQIALANWKAGDTLHSPVLMKGQVYYVWTGTAEGEDGDLSGTYIRARGKEDTMRVAVFQGCPHTCIPYKVKQRDHIFSQAMPIKYWGNTFVLTASQDRAADIVRIMALNDHTTVYVNNNPIHTFEFSNNPKHFYEFSIGPSGDYAHSGSCVLTTSCPCAAHLFIASQKYKDSDNENGDPSMMWINPIEQQIDQVTFATYKSLGVDGSGKDSKGKYRDTYHYANVVTDQPALMTLDGNSIESYFHLVDGSDTYHYAQLSLGNEAVSHTLKSNGSNFIAHVYGYTQNESYGYSAGGATKSLMQYITINGQIFTPDSKNSLCDEDTVEFACHPNYEYDSIYWYFGDGADTLLTYEQAQEDTLILHYYAESKSYEAYVDIYRKSSNLCTGQPAVARIPFTVTIGHYQFTIGEADIPCPEDGKAYIGKIPYTNPGLVDLHGENVKVEFDSIAKSEHFNDSELIIKDDYFQISIPEDADPEKTYGIHLVITSDCGGADTMLTFNINFDNDILIQRYSYLLGLKASFMEGHQLHDFQWYRYPDSTKVEGQTTSNLNFYDLPEGSVKPGDAFYLSFYMDNETKSRESCPKAFDDNAMSPDFGTPDQLLITATYSPRGKKVFVNAKWGEKTTFEDCYAEWLDVSGRVWQEKKFNLPDGGCTIDTPTESGFYILRVKTDGASRSFKMFIND